MHPHEHDQANKALRKRSGSVGSADPLVAFLYDLLRDHLSSGKMESLVREAEYYDASQFTNGWVAKYAQDLAKRLRRKKRGKS